MGPTGSGLRISVGNQVAGRAPDEALPRFSGEPGSTASRARHSNAASAHWADLLQEYPSPFAGSAGSGPALTSPALRFPGQRASADPGPFPAVGKGHPGSAGPPTGKIPALRALALRPGNRRGGVAPPVDGYAAFSERRRFRPTKPPKLFGSPGSAGALTRGLSQTFGGTWTSGRLRQPAAVIPGARRPNGRKVRDAAPPCDPGPRTARLDSRSPWVPPLALLGRDDNNWTQPGAGCGRVQAIWMGQVKITCMPS